MIPALLLAAALISGKVVDEQGKPMSGVKVGVEEVENIAQCCGPMQTVLTGADGSFSFDVPPSLYVVETMPNPAFNPDRARVDTRSSSVTGLVIRPTTGAFQYVPDIVPRAALISIGAADMAGMAPITGKPGAVAPKSIVVFSTLETGHLSTSLANQDGSFAATHFAPAGSVVQVKADPYGHLARRGLRELAQEGEGSLSALPATIVAAPDPAPSNDGSTPFASCGLHHDQRPPLWFMEGTINKRQYATGESLVIKAKLRIESRSLGSSGPLSLMLGAGVELLAGADGTNALPAGVFASTVLTPTGIPLEYRNDPSTPPMGSKRIELTRTSAERAEASFEWTVPLPAKILGGYYRPTLWLFFDEGLIPQEDPPRPLMVSDRIDGKRSDVAWLPIIRVGNPASPRLVWTLLTDELSNGSRGAVALEDAETFGLASRIVVNASTLVIPRVDERSGKPIRYRLEPFAPTISLGDRAVSPSPPRVPFRFPSGSVTVTIRKPDGSTQVIGPAPFVQSRQATPVDRNGDLLEPGSGTLSDVYQLSTMDDRFVVAFAEDGAHRITLEGSVFDVWGNEWSSRGTYDVVVARILSLDTATIPGTPFETGDALSPSIAIAPAVPADVEMRVQWVPDSNAALRRERVIAGRANRFGQFVSPDAVTFDRPGEYRVDVTARWRDPAGNEWAGSRTWGGVMAPRNSTLEAHGKRGIEALAEPNQAWFFTPKAFGHVFVPFHSGDVHWAQQYHATLPQLTFQDLTGEVVAVLKKRGTPNVDALAASGELPLFSNGPDSYPISFGPSFVDLWGYAYTAIERPLVRVREQNYTGTNLPSLYWRFRSHYARQFGMGARGDLPNDFKFQFGGAVLRGSAVGAPRYAIYGSLFVLTPDDDPFGGSRIFPPFQGSGPGGPLFTLKGRAIDLFFHPTAVRPGSVLVQGDRASFAGYSAPTIPSKINIDVTSPSGRVRTIKGQANKIGYFYDNGYDFAVDEPGVWKAKVRITFDGQTSAGQVTAPFPTGGVLGSRDGEFYFYVVRGSAAPLSVAAAASAAGQPGAAAPTQFVRPADAPIAFNITPPAGLHDVQLTYTATIPGFILEEGTTSALTYTYDAQRLARDFPNLDLYDAEGFAGVDTVVISFLLSGTDAAGKRQHFARQIVLQGEELQMPAQSATPAPPRKRAAR